ncbi:methyl-accepting chemotaxis protein [Maritimibacter dapengensis]|uniref:HAMP domain-containing protein n=1 Tax=Maritimibacter dapengensis TaxID=2836868 RepID=A0ABS6T0P3_9RHOB|nr:methyl-accepting chemotaxis protein [Maritimibacter dapengensis]MBV7378804.1 HAMP domain-containing protein [Maritimibacter dapengensis]
MRFLNNLSIARKMPIIMVFLVVISAVVSGVLSATKQRVEMIHHAEAALQAASDARIHELESTVVRAAADLMTTAGSETTAKFLAGFSQGFNVLGAAAQARLRDAYVDKNPHENRADLVETDASGLWAYAGPHKGFHPIARNLVDAFGYHDLLLVDLDGNVVYSVGKGNTFATNLAEGVYAAGPLGQLFAQMRDLGTDARGRVASVPFQPFPADAGVPATFIGTGVAGRDGKLAGFAVLRLRPTLLDDIVNRYSGLGESGVAYLVGPDRNALTDSRFETDFKAFDRLPDLPQIAAALDGAGGSEFGIGRAGQDALINYRPFNVAGLDWAMIVEQDKAEILASVAELNRSMVVQQGLVILGVSLFAFLFSSSLANPLKRVAEKMKDIAEGQYDTEVPDTRRTDEIGQIARRLEEFRVALIDSKRMHFEGNFRGAAFANSRSAIMMSDREHKILHVNTALVDILERYETAFNEHVASFEASKIVGRSMHDFHPPAIRDRVEKILSDPANLPFSTDIGFGDVRMALDISAVFDENDTHIGYATEWRDVTEGYMNNALLSAMDANQVKAEFGPDGTFLRGNQMFEDTMRTGTGGTGRIGALQSLSPDIANTFDRVVGGDAVFGRFEIPRDDGSSAMIDGSLAPVTDAGGRLLRIALIGNDVTEATAAMRASEVERMDMQENQRKVVEGLRRGLESLAEGNLTMRIEEAFSEDYEQLRADFNLAADKLLDAMRGVIENAELITGEASEISNAADDLSARTEKQAATLEETASALDQLTSSVSSAADGAAHAREIVENARTDAEASGKVVREAVEAMGEIEASSTQISKITGVIDDIAFQTNLLALNAGVEAARAGEAGRGFAVVASEVRALAQRSSDAAREINELIAASGGQVKRGVELVGQTGTALKGIVDAVTEISRNVAEIAESAREQSSGLGEINAAVNQLDQVTQQNAAMFEETTAASHALTREAESLAITMARFDTGKAGPATRSAVLHGLAMSPSSSHGMKTSIPTNPANATQSPAPSVDAFEDDGWDEF